MQTILGYKIIVCRNMNDYYKKVVIYVNAISHKINSNIKLHRFITVDA